MATPAGASRSPEQAFAQKEFRLLYLSELLKRPLCTRSIRDRIGRVTDIVFKPAEPYPAAVGIYVYQGWGKPTQFVPWEKVLRIEPDAVFVEPPPEESVYPPFVDQSGWLMANEHLMGRTIFDMDGRRIEVVNDVQLLLASGRMLIVHVDVSFNGFLRKWHLQWMSWMKDRVISWKYVQPLSLEDAGTQAAVTLSVTRSQLADLPGEDLADALEELSGETQEAMFSVLDSEKAAEVLIEAEPRAQRQIIATLRAERARQILSEMSVPQLAALFSVLPHDDMTEMIGLLPADQASRIRAILDEQETTAGALMSTDVVKASKRDTVQATLAAIRAQQREPDSFSYIYITEDDGILAGVVDLRAMVLADPGETMEQLMISPVVSAQEGDLYEDLGDMFAKYHFRLLPVVDIQDRLLGIIRYNDVMKGLVSRSIA